MHSADGVGGRARKSTTSEGVHHISSPLPPSGLRSDCRVGMGVWAMTQPTAGISLLPCCRCKIGYFSRGNEDKFGCNARGRSSMTRSAAKARQRPGGQPETGRESQPRQPQGRGTVVISRAEVLVRESIPPGVARNAMLDNTEYTIPCHTYGHLYTGLSNPGARVSAEFCPVRPRIRSTNVGRLKDKGP